MELTAGMKLGIFTIVKQIGAGGMSEVYLVKDDLGRLFALKTMSRSLSFEPSFRQRFEQEARIMASLSHPNIVQMHNFFEADGRFCLVMEYVEGGSLRDLSRKIGPIPEKRALHILQQIAKALSHAHSKGIIHRDVKPSNILLDENDNVKVMDFGIARMTEGPGLTQTGSQMGTLVYMSPEQIRDSKHVDERTDIYSLGVTLYEMLTGRPPYDEQNSSDFDIRVNIVQKELPDPRKIYPHIGDEILLLLDGLTKKKPDERLNLSKLLAEEIPKKHIQKEKPTPKVEVTEHKEIPKNRKERKKISPVIVAIIITCIVMLIAWASRKDFMFSQNSPKEGSPFTKSGVIFVEGGSFDMGSEKKYKAERPVHKVSVSSFWIGKYEVTQKEWNKVMDINPSKRRGDNYPVENITWFEAIEYCNRLSVKEGMLPCYSESEVGIICDWGANGYRLPTEAEWEYAASGGSKSKHFQFSGSNNINEVAWHQNNSGKMIQQVGIKTPNELGIYDMSGNVWEWCWDWHNESYYSKSPSIDPDGPNHGSKRTLRGGSSFGKESTCTITNRNLNNPEKRQPHYGFRVARAN